MASEDEDDRSGGRNKSGCDSAQRGGERTWRQRQEGDHRPEPKQARDPGHDRPRDGRAQRLTQPGDVECGDGGGDRIEDDHHGERLPDPEQDHHSADQREAHDGEPDAGNQYRPEDRA